MTWIIAVGFVVVVLVCLWVILTLPVKLRDKDRRQKLSQEGLLLSDKVWPNVPLRLAVYAKLNENPEVEYYRVAVDYFSPGAKAGWKGTYGSEIEVRAFEKGLALVNLLKTESVALIIHHKEIEDPVGLVVFTVEVKNRSDEARTVGFATVFELDAYIRGAKAAKSFGNCGTLKITPEELAYP